MSGSYDGGVVLPPPRGGACDWTGVGPDPLPMAEAAAWAVGPSEGAVVVFAGTVRDHAEGRPGVTGLHYEAYEEQAAARLVALAGGARARWPGLGRLVLLHRVGELAVTDVAVLVVVSAPHRAAAFEAARWCIDTAKATLPIWKREHWREGDGWGTGAVPVGQVGPVGS